MATYEYDAVRTFKLEGHATGTPNLRIYLDGNLTVDTTITGNVEEITGDYNLGTPHIQLATWTHDYTGSESGKTFSVRVEVTGGAIVWAAEKCNRTYEAPDADGWVFDFTDNDNVIGCKSNLVVDGENIDIDRATTSGNVPFALHAGETATFTMTTGPLNRGPDISEDTPA